MKIPAKHAKASTDAKVDAFTIVYSPGYRVATAKDGYQWSVSAKYQTRLNLNIDNLLADTKLRYMSTKLRPRWRREQPLAHYYTQQSPVSDPAQLHSRCDRAPQICAALQSPNYILTS